MPATLRRLLTLTEAGEQTGIPAKTLRAEVLAGRLRCYRTRPSSNAPILLDPDDIRAWLDNVCAARQFAPKAGA